MQSRDGFDWNDAAIAKLRSLHATGVSYSEMGRRLGVSKNAIAAKLARLGLCKNTSPREPGKYVGYKAMRAAKSRIREVQETMREQKIREKLAAPPVIHRTTAESCMYVLQVGPPAKYCDAPTAPGKSMCQTHCNICYRPNPRAEFNLASGG